MASIGTGIDGETAFEAAILIDGVRRAGGVHFRKQAVKSSVRFAYSGSRMGWSQAAGTDNGAEKEFLKRREQLLRIGREDPAVRLAAFLVAIVHLNSDVGSGALVISETTDAGFVADLLSLSFADLTCLLLQFKADGLVAPMPNGAMRITNLEGLERLADGEKPLKRARVSDDFAEERRVIVQPPRVYRRFTEEPSYPTSSASLRQHDSALRFDVLSLVSATCLLVASAIALGIVGL